MMADDVKTEETKEAETTEETTADTTKEVETTEEVKAETTEETKSDTTEETTEKTETADWRSFLTDPDAKKQAERFSSLDEVLKSNAELRKSISDRVKLPGKDADEKEVSKFRKALGIPEKAEDYKLELPEGMELGEADQQLIDAVKPVAHENNIPASALNGFVVKFKEFEAQLDKERVAELQKHQDASVDELRKEWGKDYDGNVNIANRAMQQFGGDDMVEFLKKTEIKDGGGVLGDSPQMVRLFAKLGRQMSEDGVIKPVDADTAKDLNEKIDELTSQAHEARAKGDKGGAAKLFKERDELQAKLSGDEPIVGAGGRSV